VPEKKLKVVRSAYGLDQIWTEDMSVCISDRVFNDYADFIVECVNKRIEELNANENSRSEHGLSASSRHC
jgi:hypothetical protein